MGTLGRAIYVVGSWIRVAGQAVDRVGCSLQGSHLFEERDAFVAPGASVIGDVQVGRGSSIWYGCVLRGDVNSIRVGSGTNIQDKRSCSCSQNQYKRECFANNNRQQCYCHGAVLHGCTVEDEAVCWHGCHFA
ncbi:putative trimeric LpxA-like superfamily protein [Helianthus annuus]|nr:putative trimeric LpxA-like superfamily protein [Helianthus annuus]